MIHQVTGVSIQIAFYFFYFSLAIKSNTFLITVYVENVSDEEKRKKWEHLLTLINEISVNLDHIQEEEKRTLCEKYRAVLQQLKEYISPRYIFVT